MSRRLMSLALVLVVAWTARPAAAQMASPLKVLPGDAAVVVRIKGYQGTLDKVAKLADAVKQGNGASVQFFGGMIGAGLKNESREGVDMAGDFYLAIFVEKDAAPGMVFVVPAKDLTAMEEALPEDITFLKQGKHGIYSDDEELIDAVKEQLKSKEKDSLADSIGEKSMAVFNRGDISVFVNVPALLEVYKDEFEHAKGFVGTIKDLTPPGDTPGVNMPALMERLQGLAGTLVEAIEDHEGITVALSVTDKDVVLEEYFKLEDDSDSGKALKANTSADLGLLNSLPADSMGYFAVQADISGFMNFGMESLESLVTDEKAVEGIKAMRAEFKNLKFTGMAGAVNFGKSDGGALQAATVTVVNDPKKMRALNQKLQGSMKSTEANGVKTEIETKPDAEKIGATSIDITTGKFTISDDAPNAEQQRAMMGLMFGKDGMITRTAYLKDRVVQVIGGNKGTMETYLKAIEGSPRTPAAGLVAVKSKLGAKPCLIGLVDIANLVVKSMAIAKDFGGPALPFDPEEVVKGLSLKPSYIGFGIEVQDAAVSVKTVVPVEQIKSLVQIGEKFQKAARGE